MIVCVAVASADAQGKKKKKRKKKKAVIEQPVPPPPVVETPVDTTPPPPPPADTPAVTEPTVKPYERIVLNVDSATNLIAYTGVVDLGEASETSSDSLYTRAKKWAVKKFGGSGKALYEVDKQNVKLVIKGHLPAFAYTNKYNKRPIGTYEFKMTIWFREQRYKYTITNLVHEGNKGNIGTAPRNYFEYYNTTTNNIKGVDQILRYADKDINDMIEGFKKAMKDPLVVDEDDW